MARKAKVYPSNKEKTAPFIVCFKGAHYISGVGTLVTLTDRVELEAGPGDGEVTVNGSEVWKLKGAYTKSEPKQKAASGDQLQEAQSQPAQPTSSNEEVLERIKAVSPDSSTESILVSAWENWQHAKNLDLFQAFTDCDPDYLEPIHQLGRELMQEFRASN